MCFDGEFWICGFDIGLGYKLNYDFSSTVCALIYIGSLSYYSLLYVLILYTNKTAIKNFDQA